MKKQSRFWKGVVLLVILLSGIVVHPCLAEDNEWHFEITPYMTLPWVDIDSTVAGDTVNVDLDPTDAFDLLKFAFSSRVQAQRENWGIFLELEGISIDESFSTPGPEIGLEIQDWLVDLGVSYRIEGEPEGIHAGPLFDVFAGLRYHYLKQEIDVALPFTALPIGIDTSTTLGQSEDWVEPIIGFTGGIPLSECVVLGGSGLLGGFDIGSASKLSWKVEGGIDWAFARRWSSKLGWKAWGMDYSRGGADDEFGLDGVFHGPYIGFTYRFTA